MLIIVFASVVFGLVFCYLTWLYHFSQISVIGLLVGNHLILFCLFIYSFCRFRLLLRLFLGFIDGCCSGSGYGSRLFWCSNEVPVLDVVLEVVRFLSPGHRLYLAALGNFVISVAAHKITKRLIFYPILCPLVLSFLVIIISIIHIIQIGLGKLSLGIGRLKVLDCLGRCLRPIAKRSIIVFRF